MKVLGNILHLANSGKLIAKTTKTPPAGAFVFTNDKQKIGKIYNTFGPVKSPYVSINIYRSVNRRDLESRHGEKLFVSTKSEMEKLNKKNKNKSGRGSRSAGSRKKSGKGSSSVGSRKKSGKGSRSAGSRKKSGKGSKKSFKSRNNSKKGSRGNSKKSRKVSNSRKKSRDK